MQKNRIVQALRSRGHVIGCVGDGINDAPALRSADVGISVENAVDVAKDAADIILLEKRLEGLPDGGGRGSFTRRYMLLIGPISPAFDFLTFGVMLWVFRAGEELFHTGWFVESLATQTLVIFVIRTAARPWASRPSAPLAWGVGASVGGGG